MSRIITLADGSTITGTDASTATEIVAEGTTTEIAGYIDLMTEDNLSEITITDEDGTEIQSEVSIIPVSASVVYGDTYTVHLINRYMTDEEVLEQRLSDIEEVLAEI